MEQAMERAEEAIQAYVESLLKHGREVPVEEPAPLAARVKVAA